MDIEQQLSTPARVAAFCVSMGYDHEQVLNTVRAEGNLSASEARQITDDAFIAFAEQTEGGHRHGTDNG